MCMHGPPDPSDFSWSVWLMRSWGTWNSDANEMINTSSTACRGDKEYIIIMVNSNTTVLLGEASYGPLLVTFHFSKSNYVMDRWLYGILGPQGFHSRGLMTWQSFQKQIWYLQWWQIYCKLPSQILPWEIHMDRNFQASAHLVKGWRKQSVAHKSHCNVVDSCKSFHLSASVSLQTQK